MFFCGKKSNVFAFLSDKIVLIFCRPKLKRFILCMPNFYYEGVGGAPKFVTAKSRFEPPALYWLTLPNEEHFFVLDLLRKIDDVQIN